MTLYGRIVVIKRSGEDGNIFPLAASTCVFGRALECDIRIFIASVSRKHCYLEINDNNQVLVVPFDDANPTKLNQETINGPMLINHGDVLTISERSFRFEYPPSSPFHSLQKKNSASEPSLTMVSGSSSDELNMSAREYLCEGPEKSIDNENSTPTMSIKKHLSEKSTTKGKRSIPGHSSLRNRKVSFGPYLSPEQYNKKFPPATPIYKGGKPPRRVSAPDYFGSPIVTPLSNIKRKRSGAPTVSSIKEESPCVKRSPLSVKNQSPSSKSPIKKIQPVTSPVKKVSPQIARSPLSRNNGSPSSKISSKFLPKRSPLKKVVSSPRASPQEKSISQAAKSPLAGSKSSPVKNPLGNFSKSSPGKGRLAETLKSPPVNRPSSNAHKSAFVKSPLAKKGPLSNSSIQEMLESEPFPSARGTPRAKRNSMQVSTLGKDILNMTYPTGKQTNSTSNNSGKSELNSPLSKRKSVSLKIFPRTERFSFKSAPKTSAYKRKGNSRSFCTYPMRVTDVVENSEQLKSITLSPKQNRRRTTSPSVSPSSRGHQGNLVSCPVTSRTKVALVSPMESHTNQTPRLSLKKTSKCSPSTTKPGIENSKGLSNVSLTLNLSSSSNESSLAQLGWSAMRNLGSGRKRSIVPKIASPNTPDVRKSKALRNIHASKIRNQSIKKVSTTRGMGSSSKKSANKISRTSGKLRKPLFSEVLKRNLKKDLVTRQLVAGVVKSRNSANTISGARKAMGAGTRYTKNVPTTTTGHANSPETIIIKHKKKIASAAKTKKGRKTPHRNAIIKHRATKGRLPKPAPVLNLSGLELLMKTPSTASKSKRQTLADSSLDFSTANASGISTSVFVSPLLSPKSINKSDVINRFLDGGRSPGKQIFPNLSRIELTDIKSPRKSNSDNYSYASGISILTRSSRSSKIHEKSPLSGIKRLMKSPQKSPTADYRNVQGLKVLFDQAEGSPKANYSFDENQHKEASLTQSCSPRTVNSRRQSASNEILCRRSNRTSTRQSPLPLETTSCEKNPTERKGLSPKISSPDRNILSTFESNKIEVTPVSKGKLLPETKTPSPARYILESSNKKESPSRREILSKTISPNQYLTERFSKSLSPVHKKGSGRSSRTASPFCGDSLKSGSPVKGHIKDASPVCPVSFVLVSPAKGSGSTPKSRSPFKQVSLKSTSPWEGQMHTPKTTTPDSSILDQPSPSKRQKTTPINFATRKSNLNVSVTDHSISVPVAPSPKGRISSPMLPISPKRDSLSRFPRRDYTEIDQTEEMNISSSSVKESKPKIQLRGKLDSKEASRPSPLGKRIVSPTKDSKTVKPRKGRVAAKALPPSINVSIEMLPAEGNMVNTKVGRKGKTIKQSKSPMTTNSDNKAVSPIEPKKRNRPDIAVKIPLNSPEVSPVKPRKGKGKTNLAALKTKITRKCRYAASPKLLTSINSPEASVASPKLKGTPDVSQSKSPSLVKSKAENIVPEASSPVKSGTPVSPKLRGRARSLRSKASPTAKSLKRNLRGNAIEPLSETTSPVNNTASPAKLKRKGRTNAGKRKEGTAPEERSEKAASPVKLRASSRSKVTASSSASTPKGRKRKLDRIDSVSSPLTQCKVNDLVETLPKLPGKRGGRSVASNSKAQKLESPNKDIQSPVDVRKTRGASQRKTSPKRHLLEIDISSNDDENIEIKPRKKLGRPKKETKKVISKSKKTTTKDTEQSAKKLNKNNSNLSPVVELMKSPRISSGKGPKTPPRYPRVRFAQYDKILGQPTPSTNSPKKSTRPSRRAAKRK